MQVDAFCFQVRSALFAFSKVVYTANKDNQYRVFKEEVRSLASEVAAAKSSSADQSAVNRIPGLKKDRSVEKKGLIRGLRVNK